MKSHSESRPGFNLGEDLLEELCGSHAAKEGAIKSVGLAILN